MPLSEHEQRLLDQIERALYTEDPKFASAVRATNPQVHFKRRIVKAVIGLVLGICVLMTGLVMFTSSPVAGTIVGGLGFVLMVFCVVWGATSWKRMTGVGAEPASPKEAPPQAKPAKAGFMERLEERWRRRHEGE